MNRMRRVTAWITIIIIVGLIIGTVICAVIGSKYFFGMLALTFLIPTVLWIYMWFYNLINDKKEKEPEEPTP